MLSLTFQESIISFYVLLFYTQIGGSAIASSMGSSSANAFLCHHEAKWLNDSTKKFKPVFYKKVLDNIYF